jgi:hypothetical protein
MYDKQAEGDVEETSESSSGGGLYLFLLLVLCIVVIPIFAGGIFDFGWYHPFVWLFSLPLTVILCGLSFNAHKIWLDTPSDIGKIVVVLFNSFMIFSISTFVTYMLLIGV